MLTPPPPKPDDDAAQVQDQVWLRGCAARERSAFEQLYRCHHPRLARFLRRFTARHDLIDDVINDTLWIVWQKAASFRGESKVSTWITGIAYRCMLKALRGTAPADEISESASGYFNLDAIAADPAVHHDAEAQRERQDWLARGLRSLPDDQRTTLELAYFMGESCESIAAIMNCAVGTVKARMFHARVRLRSVLPRLGGMRDGDGPAQSTG